jgi:hypothetical protein
MKQYPQLVAAAEAAVSGIKDADLKRVAFEKVLDDLLSEAANPSTPTPARQPSGQAGKKVGKLKRAAKTGGPKAYIVEVLDEGFFKKVKTMGEVKAELDNRGHHIPYTSLSGPLQKLCQEKRLRRQKVDQGGKKTFGYSNW